MSKFCLILTSHQLSHFTLVRVWYICRQMKNLRRVPYIDTCSGHHRYGAGVPKALYCFGFVSGGCVDDTDVAFQGYDDSNVNYSHRLDRGMYFISGTASTKFKIQVRIIVERSNHCCPKRMSPITSAQSFCSTLFYSNTRTR